MTTIDKRILVADDINRMSYEMRELYDHFGGNNVDAVGTLESLMGISRKIDIMLRSLILSFSRKGSQRSEN